MKNMCLKLFLTFFKIGLFTFGGGYAMIALLEDEFIEKRKWKARRRKGQQSGSLRRDA